MKIKKLGHCCLVIETNGKKIMTDPGHYTVEEHEKERDLDLVLITHEHLDHFNIESLKKIIKNNPNVLVITNDGVGKILTKEGIKYEVLKDKSPKDFSGVEIEAHDCRHEEIFQDFGQVLNTAYFIDKRLFFGGDSFYNPGKPIEILALPVAGPWTKVKDTIKYVIEINPQTCFPVHDGMLKFFGSSHEVPSFALAMFNIAFKNFEDKKEEEF
ncbi:MAG: MBL fold metallo-hydrolase [Candidatus Paceibacterota bacterium]|jgi:L-ascorbate metabolism protein UlaG (beta-lactamase superfamily)